MEGGRGSRPQTDWARYKSLQPITSMSKLGDKNSSWVRHDAGGSDRKPRPLVRLPWMQP